MEVQKVKGVQFNYVNFLWKEISRIQDARHAKAYVTALEWLVELLDTVPTDIYKIFKEKSEGVSEKLNALRIGSPTAPSIVARRVDTNKRVQSYAKRMVKELLREVCSELDKRNYMEKRGEPIPEGISHTLRRGN